MTTATADLAIRGGRVVTEEGVREADVLIAGGIFDAVVEPGQGRAFDEIEARGMHVFPGVVDAHAHVNEPGREDWEGWSAATRGAAAGGVTTLTDMPLNSLPPTLDAAAVYAKESRAARSAIVDYALWGGLVSEDLAPLLDLKTTGVVGVKAFLCPSGVPEFPHLDAGTLTAALAAATVAGHLVAVHAEDEALVAKGTEQLQGMNRRDRAAWLESRPPAAERRAIERLGDAARETGARVHVVHASSSAAVTAVVRAREREASVTVETCPHYLVFTAEDVDRVGPALKCAPPIRDESSRERLWQHVLAGEIDLVASDHSPCTADLKTRGDNDIWEAWGGVTGIQSLLPVMLTEGVHRRGLKLAALARLVSGAPARLLGLWPQKGAIRPGADADLALVAMDREWTLEGEQLQARSGVSPYVGRSFRGAVVRTLVRGVTVFDDGEFVEEKRYVRFGRLVRRMDA
ncbi:MAG TPA: allantoinase AllB [Candidatus Limnocylindria bacterium]